MFSFEGWRLLLIQGLIKNVKKNYSCEKCIFFWAIVLIYLSLGIHKGRQGYRRSLHPQKITFILQDIKFLNFLKFSCVIFALLDPDPADQCVVDPDSTITLMRIRMRIRILILFDADPDQTFHPDPNTDPDPSIKKKAKTLEIVSYSIHFGLSSANWSGSGYGSS